MPLYDLHYPRMMYGCNLLKLELDRKWDKDYFLAEIIKTVEAKGLKDNCRVRLSLYRTAGGYYLPHSNKAEYLIEVRPLNETGFEFNEKGFNVDIYTEIEKPVSKFSTFKTCNALIYVLAAIHRQQKGLDDCLLLNWKSRVIESIDSNIFAVKDGEVKTPPLAEGCVGGVMRESVMQMMEKNSIGCTETPFTLEDLFEADELFLTNAIHGIKWVGNYKSKKFENKVSKELSISLNKLIA